MEIINRDIIQSYVMTSAKYDFSADEKRVLTHLVEMFQPLIKGKKLEGKIHQDLFNNLHLTLPIGQFIQGNQNYKRVRDAIFSLNEKKFIYKDNNVEEVIRIIEMPKIYKRGEVQFVLNPKIVDCFLNMNKGYTKYELEVSLSFSSVYSMRLYELLSNSVTITYKIKDLKEMFGVADKYERNRDFIRRIIDTAQKELTEKAPFTFTYKLNKVRNTFDSITFNIIEQPHNQDETIQYNRLKRRVNTSMVIGNELRNYLKNTCGFSEREMNNNLELLSNFVKVFGEECLVKIRDIQVRSRKAQNPQGYIINAIKSSLKRINNI